MFGGLLGGIGGLLGGLFGGGDSGGGSELGYILAALQDPAVQEQLAGFAPAVAPHINPTPIAPLLGNLQVPHTPKPSVPNLQALSRY